MVTSEAAGSLYGYVALFNLVLTMVATAGLTQITLAGSVHSENYCQQRAKQYTSAETFNSTFQAIAQDHFWDFLAARSSF